MTVYGRIEPIGKRFPAVLYFAQHGAIFPAFSSHGQGVAMPSLETCGAFFMAAMILGIAPGPDNIFVFTQSALYGARAGLATTLGLITGLCGHTAAVALGVAALLRASPLAFSLLKFAGAAYLLYLACLSFCAGSPATLSRQESFPGYAALYRRGVIMNITNPKVTLFFLALLPQFANPARGPVALQIVIFGLLFQLATAIVFGAASMLGNELAKRIASPQAKTFMSRLAACVFAALALALLLPEG
jgi:threonine/homoserine/homoserine lactone efflux protein